MGLGKVGAPQLAAREDGRPAAGESCKGECEGTRFRIGSKGECDAVSGVCFVFVRR